MSMIEKLAAEIGTFNLSPGLRGIPVGNAPVSSANIPDAHWRPAGGEMSLPLLTLDLQAYETNKKTMLGICSDFDCQIAPHAKTPMSPVLARDLVSAGAWGVSVADLRQAEVMLHHGLRRVLIANEIGGKSAVTRLARLLRNYCEAEIFMFVDSTDVVSALARSWLGDDTLPPLNLLVEVGCGRGGVNSDTEARHLVRSIAGLNSKHIRLAGIAAYEGTANHPDEKELLENLDDLFDRVSFALKAARETVGPERPLVLSMGGSSLFDYVIDRCRPVVGGDSNVTLLLRSGACFFSDHGPIRARLQAISSRGMLGKAASDSIAGAFTPVLRIWAEVLSMNGPHNAICGFGLRDVAHDQGLPVPVAVWRNGERVITLGDVSVVSKLNDQHAFVHAPELELSVGDVIEFGIKHPCTTIDKHDVIFGLDERGEVKVALRTFFG
ncbi:UNVERIFIED_ORG: D-serine dehydratase [Rhizobium esperanzae]